MEILYSDSKIIVCVKPVGVRSTDEPGQLPDLVRTALGDPQCSVRTVHRLDQVVGGVMVLARTSHAASDLSGQILAERFEKEYLAVVHGDVPCNARTLSDYLYRNKQERKTYVAEGPGKDIQEAILQYNVLNRASSLTRLQINLLTGRTHQIRVQFSSRDYPLVGDKKYGKANDRCPIALWSHRIAFYHPKSGERMEFVKDPPDIYPWNVV